MREDPKQETLPKEEEIRRSHAAQVNKQIESKAGEIMQEGDKRPVGETVVARDFY